VIASKTFYVVVGLATIGAFVVALVALISSTGSNPPDPSASPSAPASAPQSQTATPGSSSGCLLAGAPVECSEIGSGVMVTASTCTPASIRTAWGYSADVQLAVATVPTAEGCYVTPSPVAIEGHATGLDVVRSAQGELASVLVECARREGTPAVACSEPHEVEWVSDWREEMADAPAWCRKVAAEYSSNALSAESPLRSILFPRTDGMVRCAVTAGLRTLDDSLRGIGGSELPLVEN
jgi:hypothetical protein